MTPSTQSRGSITYAMLLGHEEPKAKTRPKSNYHYPADANRTKRCAIRRDYMVEYLKREEMATCHDVAEEFGMCPEGAYKDLMKLKVEDRAQMVPGTKPVMWEAVE